MSAAAKPLEVEHAAPGMKRLGTGAKYYVGDGVYASVDRWGNVTLSTLREGAEHFIVLEPPMIERIAALARGDE